MLKFDFRVADLIDRLDWSDPDFPACVRMLDQISHMVTVDTGKETVRMHVISVDGEPSIPFETVTANKIASGTITAKHICEGQCLMCNEKYDTQL